jgi:hypothetical protein
MVSRLGQHHQEGKGPRDRGAFLQLSVWTLLPLSLPHIPV